MSAARPAAVYVMTAPSRIGMDDFAARAGMHPDLVRRFVALGLLNAWRDPSGDLWFAPAELATVARVRRLRAGLSLNYAAVGLVIDLLDRIHQLEAALRRAGGAGGTARTRVRPSPPPGPGRE
jgi:hypothetical protein